MTRPLPLLAFAIIAIAVSPISTEAQNAPLRSPPGGFERPLAQAPRRGNPGASPTLTNAEFKTLLSHWADFDANKNQRFDKAEAPELFAKLFDAADANHDGALDEKERTAVNATPAPAAATTSNPAPRSPPVPIGRRGPDPLRRAVFGPPLPGAP